MGFMKDLRDLSKAGKEASKGWDPAAQMRQANEQMKQMTTQSTLLTTGTIARATVTALRDTGTMVNYQPVVEVDVTVLPANGMPFPATGTSVGHAPLASLQPGTNIQVRYDPANPSVVALG
jgi:hypothetical protein